MLAPDAIPIRMLIAFERDQRAKLATFIADVREVMEVIRAGLVVQNQPGVVDHPLEWSLAGHVGVAYRSAEDVPEAFAGRAPADQRVAEEPECLARLQWDRKCTVLPNHAMRVVHEHRSKVARGCDLKRSRFDDAPAHIDNTFFSARS